MPRPFTAALCNQPGHRHPTLAEAAQCRATDAENIQIKRYLHLRQELKSAPARVERQSDPVVMLLDIGWLLGQIAFGMALAFVGRSRSRKPGSGESASTHRDDG